AESVWGRKASAAKDIHTGCEKGVTWREEWMKGDGREKVHRVGKTAAAASADAGVSREMTAGGAGQIHTHG
ncbi:hypothetical protein KI387_043346, partial [Taxus chinensis]